ncbi:MAG: Lipid II flippase FtsW [Candidatus Peregrinibacteria bacterium GW2011_GWA2_47_7]|nr:MAG: Lipid II flippase FtsW [Candidatus Peregrinibacteria bacterium GW2011_GWA2_47_7]
MASLGMRKENRDYVLFLVVVALLIFGLIMITSIGVPKSISLSKPKDILFPSCGVDGVDCYLLLKRHLIRIGAGIVALIVGMKIPYRFWRKIAIPFFAGAFIFLMMVFVIGSTNNTAARSWINFASGSIQPAEIAKLALIFYLAAWLERKGKEIEDFKLGFISFVVVSGIVIFPVLLQPDLGSTLVFAVIAASLYFIAGGKFRHIALGVLAIFIFILITVPSVPYLKHRFASFVNPSVENCQPEPIEGAERRNYCWQTEQANIAVGSGGLFGKGLTQGIQKSYWLPQATDDFIFAASAEELGFIRIALIVLAYAVIAYRGFLIAYYSADTFGQLAATLLGIGVLLNISEDTAPYANRFLRRRDRRTYYPQSRRYKRS